MSVAKSRPSVPYEANFECLLSRVGMPIIKILLNADVSSCHTLFCRTAEFNYCVLISYDVLNISNLVCLHILQTFVVNSC